MSSTSQADREPLTVLQLCSLQGRNGTVHMASQLCRLLAGARHRVILGTREGAKILKWTHGSGIEYLEGLVFRRGLHPRLLLSDVARIRECVRAEGVDVVHTWSSAESWVAAAALRGSRAALVRSRTTVKPFKRHALKGMLVRRTAAFLASCRRIEGILAEGGAPAEKVFPLIEGVDLARFRPDLERSTVREELQLDDTQLLVANIGRLDPIKGQKHFLRALAQLPEHVVGAIAGGGDYQPELKKEARELGLGSRVRFLGPRADVPSILAAADAYVLSSVGSEGSSRATLEAMATGLPVVCADIGMLPDIVRTAENGFLCRSGDARALADALGRIVEDGDLRRRMGEQARRFVEENRSEADMLASVEAVYRRVVAHRV
jgi:glycosyltransferase involved in cell wall biosynthesis